MKSLNDRTGLRLVCLLLASVLAAFHVLHWWRSAGLWRDEVCSVNSAQALFADGLFNSLTNDSFPVLWTALLRLWLGIVNVESDAAIRLLGLAVGLGVIGSLFLTARWARRDVPLVSMILVAMNPVVFIHGDAVRGYGIGLVALIILYGRIVRTVEEPTRRNALWLLVAALTATQLTFSNTPALAAVGGAAILHCLARRHWRALGMLCAASAAAALLLLPYMKVFAAHARWFDLVRQPLHARQILSVADAAFSPDSAWPLAMWWFLAALGAAGLCFAAWKRGWRGLTDGQRIAVLCAPLAVVLFAAYFRMLSAPVNPWHFLPLIAILGITIETGVASLYDLGQLPRLGAAAALSAAGVFACVLLWPFVGSRMTNVDLIAETVGVEATEHDLVVVANWQAEVTFARYYRGKTPWVSVPDFSPEDATAAGWPAGNLHRFQPYLLYKMRVSQPDPIRKLLARVRLTLESGRRVWIVGPIRFLKQGQTPASLPPAPDPQFGWFHTPYDEAWSEQLAQEIQTHARDIQHVPELFDVPGNPYEILPLFRVEGRSDAR